MCSRKTPRLFLQLGSHLRPTQQAPGRAAHQREHRVRRPEETPDGSVCQHRGEHRDAVPGDVCCYGKDGHRQRETRGALWGIHSGRKGATRRAQAEDDGDEAREPREAQGRTPGTA